MFEKFTKQVDKDVKERIEEYFKHSKKDNFAGIATKNELDKYQEGKLSLDKLAEKCRTRIEKKVNKDNKYFYDTIERLEGWAGCKLESVSISVNWVKSATWGDEPACRGKHKLCR